MAAITRHEAVGANERVLEIERQVRREARISDDIDVEVVDNGAIRTVKIRDSEPDMKDDVDQKQVDSDQLLYRLSEVTEWTGLSEQYVLHLIKRYSLFTPERTTYGTRSVLGFTDEHLDLLMLAAELKQRGFRMEEVVDRVRQQDVYDTIAHDLRHGLLNWLTKGTMYYWKQVVEAISELPCLSETQQTLVYYKMQGANLTECAVHGGVTDEAEAKQELKAAYCNMADDLLVLLRKIGEKNGK